MLKSRIPEVCREIAEAMADTNPGQAVPAFMLPAGLRPVLAPQAAPAPEVDLDNVLRRLKGIPLTRRMAGGGIRFYEARAALPELSREAFDKAIIDLRKRRELALYAIEVPTSITQADREAVLLASGYPKHYFLFR